MSITKRAGFKFNQVFTGIIEELGQIREFKKDASGARIKISANLVTEDAREGDSIAVNGVCLTALEINRGSFAADVSSETLRRTTLGDLQSASKVNLERAATVSTRLGGHIVQGHIDATGNFLSAEKSGDFWTVRIKFPPEIGQYLVYKGSIAVEGISLTIARLAEDFFEIAVIPKTWALTNLSTLKTGDAVNLEADIIAKYVERIMLFGGENQQTEKAKGVTKEKLQKLGFI